MRVRFSSFSRFTVQDAIIVARDTDGISQIIWLLERQTLFICSFKVYLWR